MFRLRATRRAVHLPDVTLEVPHLMSITSRWIACAIGALPCSAATVPALAQAADIATLPYYDDRSSPQTLIFSLYNAINRREYSRAHGYFGTPPSESVDAYARGFDETAMVQIATGRTQEEGAAGSVHATVPLVIRSVAKDGGQAIFRGCVVARLANPLIVNDDFRGWHIERTAIGVSDEPFVQSLPDCDQNGTPTEPPYGPEELVDTPPESLPQVIALTQAFVQRDRTICDDSLGIHPESLVTLPPSPEASQDEAESVLASFVCGRGAYNLLTRWFSTSEIPFSVSHSFAEPEIEYELGPSPEEGIDGPVERIGIVGWSTSDQLVNAGWDDERQALVTYNKWRGIGDAFSSATYRWNGRGFILSEFEVDPSFDGEQDPVTIFPVNAMTGSRN